MLVEACEEVRALNLEHEPEFDMAIAVISGRIGFFSPMSTMTRAETQALLIACERGDDEHLILGQGSIN
jgi:hypothetical protein